MSSIPQLHDNVQSPFLKGENEVFHRVRAKYYPSPDGGLRLASVAEFNSPVFREDGYEEIGIPEDPLDFGLDLDDESVIGDSPDADQMREVYAARAIRRAKTQAFDYIVCNPDIDCFVTLTYSPEMSDRTSYDDVYGKLKTWLSNRVTRKGLKYVCVPEYHHDGEAIHFHLLVNRRALTLVDSGHKDHGKKVYNVADWNWGFSTAKLITCSEVDRVKVSKYIFKYMGKQSGQKIGGRYFLHGGIFTKPVYLYGDDAAEFIGEEVVQFAKDVTIGDSVHYREWNFI